MSVLRLASVLVLSTVVAVFGMTAGAAAQSGPSTAPPGNSAVDQYRESAPPSSTKQRKLQRRDREALERRGADGAALAAVLERAGGVPRAALAATDDAASGKTRKRTDARSDDDSGARSDAGDGATGSKPGAAADPADDARAERSIAPAAASSTVGPVPVWVMLAGAVALVGVGLLVRRRITS